MLSIKEKAFAKINLLLDVVGKRSDGYHDLEMIMQSVNLYDDVCVEKTDDGITIYCEALYVPNNHKNIAWKAAQAFIKKFGIKEGVKISINKKIPVAAGLAGGSTDAAAVIRAMVKLFNISATDKQLNELALSIGADVPYCLKGGTCVAKGLGEQLTEIANISDIPILLVKPSVGVSTPWCFKNYNSKNVTIKPDLTNMINNIEDGNIEKIANSMCNVLETVTIPEYPIINEIKEKMIKGGALGTIMSGSGPTVFGIFSNEEILEQAYTLFDKKEVFVYKTKTI